jgi:hypothetical protein
MVTVELTTSGHLVAMELITIPQFHLQERSEICLKTVSPNIVPHAVSLIQNIPPVVEKESDGLESLFKQLVIEFYFFPDFPGQTRAIIFPEGKT